MISKQHPIVSGFGASTTADEVIAGIDLTGKTAIVTGGYSGLGLETVRVLRRAGARVVAPARDMARAQAALQGTGAEAAHMDLLDAASIAAFTSAWMASGQPVHMLVNSAGIMAVPELTRDRRGYEIQFATNHLGHFQLVRELLPALRAAGAARVVSVSSLGHRFSPVRFDDPHFLIGAYDTWAAYGQSKTANALFAVALDAREKANGVRAFSLHPGAIVETGLGKHMSREQLMAAGVLDAQGRPVRDPSRQLKTVGQGAATQVWCAVSPQLNGMGGLYCENVDVASPMPADAGKLSMAEARTLTGVMPYAMDTDAAERLWALSEELLG